MGFLVQLTKFLQLLLIQIKTTHLTKENFLKLLADNKGEGNSAGNVVGVLTHNVDSFGIAI